MPTEEDLSYMNPALAVEAQRLAQRKEELKAQALEARRQLGLAPQGQMVGNGGFQHYVAPHWSQQAAPVVSTALNRLDQRQLDTDTAAFDQREQQAARAHMARMPVTRSEPGPYGVAVTVEPTDQERLRWAQQGMLIPSLAPTMKAYLDDQLIKAPDRAENRAWRSSESELNRQSRADQATRDRESREQMARQANELRETIAQLMGGKKVPVANGSGSFDPITGKTTPTGFDDPNIKKEDRKKTESLQEELRALEGSAKSLLSIQPDLDVATWLPVLGPGMDAAAGVFNITPEGKAARERISTAVAEEVLGRAKLVKPVSEKDLPFLERTLGNLADVKSTGARQAAFGQAMQHLVGRINETRQLLGLPPIENPLNKSRRAGGPVSAAPAPVADGANGLPQPRTQAEFDALPKGTVFLTEDGRKMTKR